MAVWSVFGTGDAHTILDFGAGRRPRVTTFGDLIVGTRHPTVNASFAAAEVSDETIRLHEQWDLTALVGVFTLDELVVGGTSGADGYLNVSTTPITIIVRQGRFVTGETITGNTSGATATINVGTHGRASQGSGFMAANTGTNTDTTLIAESARPSPYVSGSELFAMFTAIWAEGGAAGVEVLAGLGNDENRVQVGYQGAAWGLYYLNGLAPGGVFTAQADLDDPLDGTGASGITLDTTKLNVWAMSFGYLGAAGIEIYLLRSDATWHQVHQIQAANLQAYPIFSNPNLNVMFTATKTAGDANNYSVACASWTAGNTGPNVENANFHTIGATLLAIAPATETVIWAARMLRYHAGVHQHTSARLRELSVTTDGNKNVIFRVRKNAIITGGAWSDTDQYNSHIEQNTTPTGFSGGVIEEVYGLTKLDKLVTKLDISNFLMQPGETMCVTAISANASDVTAYGRFAEGLG